MLFLIRLMLGGKETQNELNYKLKDSDESASQLTANKWKGLNQQFTNNPIFNNQQLNSDFSLSRPKKNTKNSNNNNNNNDNGGNHALKQNFPLINSLLSINKLKNAANKQKNNNSNLKSALIADFNNWSEISKKQRSELQGAASNQQNVFILRPLNGKNKHARDDRKLISRPQSISRVKEPSRDMRPPPPLFRPKLKL